MGINKPNRYREARLAQLQKACERLSAALQDGKQRSRPEREAMRDDLVELLAAFKFAVGPHPDNPCTPENDMRRGLMPMVEAYVRYERMQIRTIRYALIRRAAELALGDGATAWMNASKVGVRVSEETEFVAMLTELASHYKSPTAH